MTTNDNQPPPLTAEDIAPECEICGAIEPVEIFNDGCTWCYGHLPKLRERYIQQTAAKDARIAELEGEIRAFQISPLMVANAYDVNNQLRAERDALQARVAELEQDGTYKDTCDFLNNLCKRLATERDAAIKEVGNSAQEVGHLQSQLDAANAQLVMVRNTLSMAPLEVLKELPHGCGGDFSGSEWEIDPLHCNACLGFIEWDKAAKNALNQTQPTTEQWLAERDAALLKPWREAVQVLREACMSVLDEKTELALKATEGLV